MKIIYVAGSPRKNGNTVKVYSELKKYIPSHIEMEIMYLADYKIEGCIGCSKCQSDLEDTGCVQQDDVKLLLDKLIHSDMIIYGTALYGHSYTGQLKIFLDRHVPLFKFISGEDKSVDEMEIRSIIKDKPVALVVCCQDPEEQNTELIKAQFDMFCESSLTRQVNKYIFPFCNDNSENTRFSMDTLEKMVFDIKRNMK